MLAALTAASVAGVAPARADDRVGRYIVVLNPGAGDPGAVASEHANEHSAVVTHVYRYSLSGYAAAIPEARLDDLRSDPRVAYISEDGIVEASHHRPNHGTKPQPTPAPPPAQSLPTGVNRIDGELSSTVAGDGSGAVDVDVAVIDTGIDLDHPDLNVYSAGGKNCTTSSGFDDPNGHGTHVAGTIGAVDNTAGVVGVAPGARVWPVRVLDARGSGFWSWIICGVDWVTQNASSIEVANMSLGGSGSEPSDPDMDCVTGNALHDAICRSVTAGVTYTVAAGNESTNASTRVPASFNEVITVSALADFDGLAGGTGGATCRSDVDDTFADFSNYGADVDLIAPGVCINSTWKGGGYNSISGTSMAAPHAAGAAALYQAGSPTATPAQTKAALQASGTGLWVTSSDRDTTHEPLLNVDPL
ncbi:MAG: S8 family serine peptidase [Actinomycetota bacterium]